MRGGRRARAARPRSVAPTGAAGAGSGAPHGLQCIAVLARCDAAGLAWCRSLWPFCLWPAARAAWKSRPKGIGAARTPPEQAGLPEHAPAVTPKALLAVPEVLDLGVLQPASTPLVRATVRLVNGTERRASIAAWETSCPCVRVHPARVALPSGASSVLKLEIDLRDEEDSTARVGVRVVGRSSSGAELVEFLVLFKVAEQRGAEQKAMKGARRLWALRGGVRLAGAEGGGACSGGAYGRGAERRGKSTWARGALAKQAYFKPWPAVAGVW